MTVVNIDGTEWTLGDGIGAGGFGKVYAASCRDERAVIKLVPKAPDARRELLFGDDLRGLPGIVPIMGVGETDEYWALLMPRAQYTLRTFLTASGRLDHAKAYPILLDNSQALVRLAERRVVHRDLKPENILMLGGAWCLSDFGISRYAEATTELETRKGLTTRPYAAPEQWRDERATSASDVYALGVICHELLSGQRPFDGPDFREQHLHQEPPTLTEVPPSLAALIHQCLAKPPGARPQVHDLPRRLAGLVAQRPVSGGLAALRDAVRGDAERQVHKQAQDSRQRSAEEMCAELAQDAQQQLARIASQLLVAISTEVDVEIEGIYRGKPYPPSVGPLREGKKRPMLGKSLMFRQSCIQVRQSAPTGILAGEAWDALKTDAPFHIVASSDIAVARSSPANRYTFVGRAHSLWYCDAVTEGDYGWFETAFCTTRFLDDPEVDLIPGDATNFILGREGFDGIYTPRAASIGEKFGKAETEAVHAAFVLPTDYWLARPLTRLDEGDLGEFIDRWATWFAQSVEGSLSRPEKYPESDPSGSWRGEFSMTELLKDRLEARRRAPTIPQAPRFGRLP